MEYLDVEFSPKEYKRVFNKFSVDKETGCWNWMGGKDQEGYPQGYYNHRRERVHRIIYSLLIEKIPRGKVIQLDHLCRNKSCCNPEHLELVTQKVNTIRSDGITAQNSRKTFCKYGHPLPPYDIEKPRKFCKTCDSIRHKKRLQGPQRDHWLRKAREASARFRNK